MDSLLRFTDPFKPFHPPNSLFPPEFAVSDPTSLGVQVQVPQKDDAPVFIDLKEMMENDGKMCVGRILVYSEVTDVVNCQILGHTVRLPLVLSNNSVENRGSAATLLPTHVGPVKAYHRRDIQNLDMHSRMHSSPHTTTACGLITLSIDSFLRHAALKQGASMALIATTSSILPRTFILRSCTSTSTYEMFGTSWNSVSKLSPSQMLSFCMPIK